MGLPANTTVAEVRLQMAILANVPFSEEPGEAGRLQADLAMRITPPDLASREGGVDALPHHHGNGHAGRVAGPGEVPPRRRALSPQGTDLARKWLEQIGSDAPIDVVAPGRFLLARVRVAENKDWLSAIRDLEVVRASPAAGPSLKRWRRITWAIAG